MGETAAPGGRGRERGPVARPPFGVLNRGAGWWLFLDVDGSAVEAVVDEDVAFDDIDGVPEDAGAVGDLEAHAAAVPADVRGDGGGVVELLVAVDRDFAARGVERADAAAREDGLGSVGAGFGVDEDRLIRAQLDARRERPVVGELAQEEAVEAGG